MDVLVRRRFDCLNFVFVSLESSTSSQPSALYGQPAWWGQDEDVQGEETCSQDREESGQSEARRRSGTYTAYDKGKLYHN